MSEKDLTRWNRSGLSRLNYLNGNAATFLEEIRAALEQRFTGSWQGKLDPPETGSDLEDDEEWIQQATNTFLIEQYRGERGDIGWELARAFVRSCHVLTGHLNAHANETFLRTATQWDYIRKMVAMLDYRPAGAASATTLLAIQAKSNASGKIAKGLQVRHRSVTGGMPIVFETLEDIEINSDYNLFQVDGHNRSPKELGKAEISADESKIEKSPWLAARKAPVFIHDSVLILEDSIGSQADAAWIIAKQDQYLKLAHESTQWTEWKLGEVRLKSSPRFKRLPWMNGEAVRRATKPHGISKGSVIAWRAMGETNKYAWCFAEIKNADSLSLELVKDEEKFEMFVDENGDEAYFKDDIWPLFNDESFNKIEVKRATKITGSFAVPANSDAEKRIGNLAKFTAANIIPKGTDVAGSTEIPIFGNPNEAPDEPRDPVSWHDMTDTDLKNFIIWLFGAIGFSPGFPISPKMLITIGAMLKIDDSRIPSTGQLVFEAFLDIFGGGAGDKITIPNSPPNPDDVKPPALFRFWVNGDVDEDSWQDDDSFTGRLPRRDAEVQAEFWYLPKEEKGGGDIKLGPNTPKNILLINKSDDNWFFFNGRPTGLIEGNWVAAKFKDERWYAAKIERIQLLKEPTDDGPVIDDTTIPPDRHQHPAAFALKLARLNRPVDEHEKPLEMIELNADFRHTGEPLGAERNEKDLETPLVLTPCPKNLTVGRTLNLTVGRTLLAVNDSGETLKVRVESFDPKTCALIFKPSLPDSFNQGNLKLFGNVVLAGHGERRPAVSLGAGVGVQRQNFLILDKTEVSTVPDKRMAGGVREDLAVHIGDEQWQQVANFDHSEPTDPHFTVTTTEEGFLNLQFGDDRQGRTLPAGTNNVRVDYRVGAGRRGSVPAGSLEKLVQPHPLVESVSQPFEAIGGEDMEPPEQMRERAPASLLALERAVSISDFEQLAMQHRSVWQARAFYYIGAAGLRDKVEVIVALAEGKELVDENLNEEITDYLQQRAVPTVQVVVESYDPIEIDVKINFRLNSAIYEESQVVTDVKNALVEAFSVERRRINQALHLSEIYAVVEKVPGVEDSTCAFLDDKLEPTEQQLILSGMKKIVFIANEDALTCVPGEYQP